MVALRELATLSTLPGDLKALFDSPALIWIGLGAIVVGGGGLVMPAIQRRASFLGFLNAPEPKPRLRMGRILVTQRQAMHLIQHSEAFPRSARMVVDEEAREREAFRLTLLFEKERPEAMVGSRYSEFELEAWLADRASRGGPRGQA